MSAAAPTLEELRAGGKPGLARLLARIEAEPGDPGLIALLDAAWGAPRGHVLGITGPPGVGKSTLVNALIASYRDEDATVGVIAVDPSSRRSGGALLGDRTRLATDPADQGVFVRSMAARGSLGGLAGLAVPAMALMRALFDVVIIETVGVGQSESDILDVADTVMFCVQPASGDSLQFMKAGIAEVPDLAIVTKSDLGAPARRAASDFAAALSLAGDAARPVPVLQVSAQSGEGVGDLRHAITEHGAWLGECGRLAARRRAQAAALVAADVRARFGEDGLDRLAAAPPLAGDSPFSARAEAARVILSGRAG